MGEVYVCLRYFNANHPDGIHQAEGCLQSKLSVRATWVAFVSLMNQPPTFPRQRLEIVNRCVPPCERYRRWCISSGLLEWHRAQRQLFSFNAVMLFARYTSWTRLRSASHSARPVALQMRLEPSKAPTPTRPRRWPECHGFRSPSAAQLFSWSWLAPFTRSPAATGRTPSRLLEWPFHPSAPLPWPSCRA